MVYILLLIGREYYRIPAEDFKSLPGEIQKNFISIFEIDKEYFAIMPVSLDIYSGKRKFVKCLESEARLAFKKLFSEHRGALKDLSDISLASKGDYLKLYAQKVQVLFNAGCYVDAGDEKSFKIAQAWIEKGELIFSPDNNVLFSNACWKFTGKWRIKDYKKD